MLARVGTIGDSPTTMTIDDTIAQQLVSDLARGRMQIALAESCTGGLISAAITAVPGSSAVFSVGWTVYSDEAKRDLLSVPEETLRDYGAVSEPTVRSLLAGLLLHTTADVVAAVSGIAGPTGGTDAKPVGTVYYGVRLRDGSPTVRCARFEGTRDEVRAASTRATIALVREAIAAA